MLIRGIIIKIKRNWKGYRKKKKLIIIIRSKRRWEIWLKRNEGKNLKLF